MADLEEAPIATECSSVLVSVGTAAAAGERAPTPTFDVWRGETKCRRKTE